MSFKFKFRLDKRRSLDNGKYPIKVNLHVTDLGRNVDFNIPTTYIDGKPYDASCKEEDWSSIWEERFKINSFGHISGEKPVFGEKLIIRTILKTRQDQLQEIISRDEIRVYKQVKDEFYKKIVRKGTNDLFDCFEAKIESELDRNSINNASVYQNTLNQIKKFTKGESTSLYEINVQWLEKYEAFRKKKIGVASLGIEMRNIRTVLNDNMDDSLSKIYPFRQKASQKGKYLIQSLKKGRDTKLDKDQIKKLRDYTSKNKMRLMARDFFLFSYYSAGMNLTDIARLEKDSTGFIRKKSNSRVTEVEEIPLRLNDLQKEIISRHKGKGKYMFNILNDKDSPETIVKKVNNKTSQIYKQLKKISKELGFEKPISMNWARHSYATILANSNKVDINTISKALGHTSIKTTENYLSGFNIKKQDLIDEALDLED